MRGFWRCDYLIFKIFGAVLNNLEGVSHFGFLVVVSWAGSDFWLNLLDQVKFILLRQLIKEQQFIFISQKI
jgi:hypothetical protein